MAVCDKAESGRTRQDSTNLLRQLSRQSSDGSYSCVTEELELLLNVYLDEELHVVSAQSKPVVLNCHITPSTAEDKTKQFVYINLLLSLPEGYPHSLPEVTITQSRGLSDAHLKSIIDGMRHLSVEYCGLPMVYNLIEFVKDCLTDNNRPCGQCAFCLFSFQEDEEFVRTECYHYFHPSCLASYIKFCEAEECDLSRERSVQYECPVCRATVTLKDPYTLHLLDTGLHDNNSSDEEVSFELTPELLQWQKEMALIYQKQLAKGGIVNIEDEQHIVIEDTWVVLKKDEEKVEEKVEVNEPQKDEEKVEVNEPQKSREMKSNAHHKQDSPRYRRHQRYRPKKASSNHTHSTDFEKHDKINNCSHEKERVHLHIQKSEHQHRGEQNNHIGEQYHGYRPRHHWDRSSRDGRVIVREHYTGHKPRSGHSNNDRTRAAQKSARGATSPAVDSRSVMAGRGKEASLPCAQVMSNHSNSTDALTGQEVKSDSRSHQSHSGTGNHYHKHSSQTRKKWKNKN